MARAKGWIPPGKRKMVRRWIPVTEVSNGKVTRSKFLGPPEPEPTAAERKWSRLADTLRERGIQVELVRFGNDTEDGEIVLSSTVHIQIPTSGSAPGVVAKVKGKYRFYPTRRSVAALCEDIAAAMKAAPPTHDCWENAEPYTSDGALGHGFKCGVCGAFLQAG